MQVYVQNCDVAGTACSPELWQRCHSGKQLSVLGVTCLPVRCGSPAVDGLVPALIQVRRRRTLLAGNTLLV